MVKLRFVPSRASKAAWGFVMIDAVGLAGWAGSRTQQGWPCELCQLPFWGFDAPASFVHGQQVSKRDETQLCRRESNVHRTARSPFHHANLGVPET